MRGERLVRASYQRVVVIEEKLAQIKWRYWEREQISLQRVYKFKLK